MKKITFAFTLAFLFVIRQVSAQEFTTRTEKDTLYLVRTTANRDKEGRIGRSETLIPFRDTAALTTYLIDQSRALLQRSAEHAAAAQSDNELAKKVMDLASKMPPLPKKPTAPTAATLPKK